MSTDLWALFVMGGYEMEDATMEGTVVGCWVRSLTLTQNHPIGVVRVESGGIRLESGNQSEASVVHAPWALPGAEGRD
jgi:hypothetical protein